MLAMGRDLLPSGYLLLFVLQVVFPALTQASKLACNILSLGLAVSFKCGVLLPSVVLDSAKVGLFITHVPNAFNFDIKYVHY